MKFELQLSCLSSLINYLGSLISHNSMVNQSQIGVRTAKLSPQFKLHPWGVYSVVIMVLVGIKWSPRIKYIYIAQLYIKIKIIKTNM